MKDGADDEAAQVVALWAVGQAHRELNEVGAACASLQAAVDLAAGAGDDETEARIRMSLSVALFTRGDKAGAFRELDAAADRLTGTEHARALMQRGLLQLELGELEDAVHSLDQALPALKSGGDRLAEARLRVNRAAASTRLGRLRLAEHDLLAAQSLAGELGQKLIAAGAQHNLGFVASRGGDVPGALEWYDRARASYEELADPRRLVAVLDVDRCETLLAAGLSTEAAAAAARAVDAHTRDGNEADLADAELLLAHAQLSSGRCADASSTARRSRERFERSERRAWAALAAYVEIQAEVLGSPLGVALGPDVLERTAGLAEELDDLGWRNEALHVRSFAARIAMGQGDLGRARRQLEVASAARHRGPAAERVQAWYAAALLRHLEGDDSGARRALDAGLRLVDVARSGLGSSELRAAVSHHGADLVVLGLELARAHGRPRSVLAWLERCRALALLAPPARPPDDAGFAAELAALRQARGEARDRVAAGQAAAEAQARVVGIERAVRERARHAGGTGAAPTPAVVRADLAELGDQALLEYFQADGRLFALVARDGRVTQHDLGPLAGLGDDLESLGFALHRLARTQGSAASRSLAARTVDELGTRIGQRLVGPVLRRLDRRCVVVVPDPSLHGVPWAALPELAARPVAVSPSLRAHTQARQASGRPARGAPPLLVAGPGLPGAEDEVARLASLHQDAVVLTGGEATVAAVCEALGRYELAHLACHGRVRVDNPLFSSLTMADGELTVYDLEGCPGVAQTIVLSACSTGLDTIVTGTEALGLSAALLSLGCGTVVAPMAPVSDRATAPLMVALHHGLRRGERPSVALHRARPDPGDGPEVRASWAALAAFGAG